MTTAHQVFPRQVPPLSTGTRPRRPGDLPEPGERRRLRERWGLSTRQVALAFGVTPATIRSWESGRSTPRGGRKEAYRRFLAGLDQHGDIGSPSRSPRHGGRQAEAPRHTRTPSSAGPANVRPHRASPQVGGPTRSGPLRVRHVGGNGVDPVSPARIRRLRLMGAALCVWSLAWWVVLTCPPPL
ncbi:helix-turn-helix domain-containing protein [Streptomyces hydrogenans]|uniref:helix-turn-helix domain-containing protein n=1 Tax=Streptomyces hydrogenans TaxID=1873719 RepID=UPI0035DD5154